MNEKDYRISVSVYNRNTGEVVYENERLFSSDMVRAEEQIYQAIEETENKLYGEGTMEFLNKREDDGGTQHNE